MRSVLYALALGASLACVARAGELEIHFLNVGQAASTFVRGPNGTRVLIDAGDPGDGNSAIKPYLLSIGVSDLDVSVATHWHADHIGGMDELFNAGIKPPIAFDRGDAGIPGTNEVASYLAAASGIRQTPALGQQIALGDGAYIEVVALNGLTPAGQVSVPLSEGENPRSIALLIRYKDFDCFVGGDLTSGGSSTPNVEVPVAAYVGQVEVAQSSHHGSDTSSAAAVVASLAPSLVIHSCGLDNSYGHPTAAVTNRWNSPSACRAQWSTTEGDTQNGSGGFTATNAHIVVRSDGTSFRAQRVGGAQQLRFATFEQPAPAPAPGSLRIAELLVDPLAAQDAYGEWLELSNTAAEDVDLYGLQLASGANSFTVASHIVLAMGERLVLGVDGKPSRNGNLFVGLGAPWQSFGLDNASGTLTLSAPGGAQLDQLSWGPGALAIAPGQAAEREDLYASALPANFTNAVSAWSGGDKGSPWGANAADATDWPAGLYTPDAHIGGDARFSLSSLDEPGLLYFLGFSLSTNTGIDALGQHLVIDPDALFSMMLSKPKYLASLDPAGRKQLSEFIPADPMLVGTLVHAQYLTMQFLPGGLAAASVSNAADFALLP